MVQPRKRLMPTLLTCDLTLLLEAVWNYGFSRSSYQIDSQELKPSAHAALVPLAENDDGSAVGALPSVRVILRDCYFFLHSTV